MEPLWILSETDNSIDLLGGALYLSALFYSVLYIIKNNINIQGKIIYGLIAIISILHLVQVASQLYFGGPVSYTFRLWDFINYLTGVCFLMASLRIHRKEVK